MIIEIRPADREDLEDLVMLCRQIHELHAGLYPNDFQPDDKASIRALLAKVIAGKDESIFIARVDGKGVGYIWFEELGSHDGTFAKRPRRLYVNHIGVDPAYRRKGIARRLMNRVTTEAGTRQITLDSWAANAGAHAFFESLGFEPLRILFRRHGSLER